MRKALLIQANGNNVRLGRFFKQPKYELYYKGRRIIDHICDIAKNLVNVDVFLALREDVCFIKNDNNSILKIIKCKPTYCRQDTLKNLLPFFEAYEELIIHDCDVIINADILQKLKGNSIAVSTYKNDGMRYGFIELDENFQFIKGNEKEYEADYISIGAYSVVLSQFNKYIQTATEESLLHYFNNATNTTVVYSKTFLNLGDIDSYIANLWKL